MGMEREEKWEENERRKIKGRGRRGGAGLGPKILAWRPL